MSRLEDIAEKIDALKLPEMDFEQVFKNSIDDTQRVKRVTDFLDDLDKYLDKGDDVDGARLPFKFTHKKFGFREGEVTMWSGYNGHKKSMLLGYCCVDLIKQKERVCIASFEMKAVSTIVRMAKQLSGDYSQDVAMMIPDFVQFAMNDLYLFDHLGQITPQRVYGVIVYCAKELGVKHFVIDSLMRVIGGEDKYNEQKDFVVQLCNLAMQYNVHIHLVHHTRKGNEDVPPSRYDAKGSGAISDNVHNSLTVWSNKNKIEGAPDVLLRCDKQRNGEWEGSVNLNFDKVTLSFLEGINYD